MSALPYFVKAPLVTARWEQITECASIKASTAVSKASFSPMRAGISNKKSPYAQWRLNLRSDDGLMIARNAVCNKLDAVLNCNGGLFVGDFFPRSTARESSVPLCSLKIYLCCPDPVQANRRRVHREQDGFAWSHYVRRLFQCCSQALGLLNIPFSFARDIRHIHDFAVRPAFLRDFRHTAIPRLPRC